MSDHPTPASAERPSSLRVHQFHGLRPGPRLIVLGAVHGNEVAGPLAIGRALAELDAGRWRIERGVVTFVPVTNPLAHALGQRTGDRSRDGPSDGFSDHSNGRSNDRSSDR